MAVSRDYDGSRVAPAVSDGAVRVTWEWLSAHVSNTPENEALLQKHLRSQAICPRVYYFEDAPEVRALLGIEAL